MARRTSRSWIFIAGLGLVAAGLLALLFWPRPLTVDAATVERGPIADMVADQGVARVRQAYMVSAPVSGRLERLPLEVGDPVVAGVTVVARLRPAAPSLLDPRTRSQAEAAVAAARSSLAAVLAQRRQLNAEAARAAGELARLAPLAQKGFIAAQALDNAAAAASAAEQSVRAADAQVRARRADVATAESALMGPEAAGPGLVAVTSPASGVVTRLAQQSERDVTAGSPLIEVGATQGLEAQIEFLTQDAVRIRTGMPAEIFNWGGSRPIAAQVRRVEPQGFTKVSALGVEEQRALVMLQLTGPPSDWAGLQPGYRVWARVFLRRAPSAVVASTGTLVRDAGGWAVFRIEAGRARLRPVRIGAMTDDKAEILSGLAVGDRLVDFPSDEVSDGKRVKARRQAGGPP